VKTADEIARSADGLRKNLVKTFGGDNFNALVAMVVRSKLEARKIEMISTHLDSLSAEDLEAFRKTWTKTEAERL
jgi:hypothetical protein